MNQLDVIANLRRELLKDNSSTYKKNILKSFISAYINNALVMNVLYMIFNSEKYLITSKIFEGIEPLQSEESKSSDDQVSDVLAKLKDPNISASQKKDELKAIYSRSSVGGAEILECILDKDFKCGLSKAAYKDFISTKATLGVALANKYADKKKKVNFEKDTWYASRKLDGCRLNIVKEGDTVRALSRTGKPYTSLDVLTKLFERIPGDFVLDGEVITKSGVDRDDFKSIVSQIKRKDYTIPDPIFMIFDMYSPDVAYGKVDSDIFSVRYHAMYDFVAANQEILRDHVLLVEQKKVMDEAMLNEFSSQAAANGWEGLMIRKDTIWEGKRTDNLLKIKEFHDGEFTITGYTLGDFRYKNEVLHNVLASVDVDYKGYKCSVGSGWSLDERLEYAKNPEALVGKTLKVKYFEETTNAAGEKSMRFPTKVFLYGEEGRFD